MITNTKLYLKEHFKSDFFASIVVFLVALPLCLGIAIASGVPPAMGLLSGIIGGLVVGYFSGCPLQVSGPAAGLVAIVFEIIQEHGLEKLGAIILAAGMMQIAAGVLGLGPWFRAVSPSVIHGMLAGIGILIFSSQFHVMVDDLPKSTAVLNILSLPASFMKGVTPMDTTSHHLAAFVGIITILIMILWEIGFKKIKIIPPALIGVLTVTCVAFYFKYPIKYVSVPENIFSAIKFPAPESFTCLLEWGILIEALTIAFIASAETLLTSTAIDQMQTSHRTNYNKEIIAQGIGNSLAGFIGAVPITGVIVRSAANVNAGAKTKMSAILHGLWMLLFVSVIPFTLGLIPIASLAAVLVYTGYKLINLNAIKNLAKFGRGEVIIYFATMIVIVMDSLLEGVLIGIILSVIKLLYNFSKLEFKSISDEGGKVIHLHIDGCATFINLPKFADNLESIPAGKKVFVYLERLNYFDHACLEFLTNWEKKYESKGGKTEIKWREISKP